MIFIACEHIKLLRSLKTRDIWILLESRLQTSPNQWASLFLNTFIFNLIHILYSDGDCIQEMKALLSWIFSDVFPKNPLPLSNRSCSLPLYAPSAMRCSRATCAGYFARDTCALQLNPPFKHISINDGQIDVDKIANIMGLIIWAAPSRRTPESAPTSWISSRSIWLNIFLKLFAPHIYFNHTTLMKQSLKTLSLEDLRFPTKCAPKKSALLTEVLKQPLLSMLFNQIRSFLSLFFICSNIWISPTSTPLNNL